MAKISKTPQLRIYNTNMKFKRTILNCAKSEGKTCTQFVLWHLRKIIETYPEKNKNYSEDDGC